MSEQLTIEQRVESDMVESFDGKHAVEIGPGTQWYGWLFYKHPDGQWVSLRKAQDEELQQAWRKRHGTGTSPGKGDGRIHMSDSSSSNPLLARLKGWCEVKLPNAEHIAFEQAVSEIERLTARVNELEGKCPCCKTAEDVLALIAERDRLKATVEELWTVSAGLRAALRDLLEDTQHVDHNCGDTAENCPVIRASEALAGSSDSKGIADAAVETKDPR